MRFDWTDLQLFVHACDAGSLTGAARRAHLTLAAVSARIRTMESDSGVTLLQRHSRGVRPTAAGEALLRHARAVISQMAQLRDELAQHGGSARQRIRLLANTSAMAMHVAAPAGNFLAHHPDCELSVEESESHMTVQALRQGLADAGIVSDAVDVDGLQTHPLGDDTLVLLMPGNHPLARSRQPTFTRALDFPWVGCGAATALHTHLSIQAAQLGKKMQMRATASQFGAVQDLVAQGLGLAVIPAAIASGKAVAMPLLEPWARRKLLLCTSSERAARPSLQALLKSFGVRL